MSTNGNVIVVGAGMAGLTAARVLVENDFSVVVLEARDRAGGRIWTDTSLGVPVDLGAAWIHGIENHPIYELCRQYEIETQPTDYSRSCLLDDQGASAGFMRKVLFAVRADRILNRLRKLAQTLEEDISVAEGVRLIAERANFGAQEMCFINRYLIEFEAFNAAPLEEQSLFGLVFGGAYSGTDCVLPGGYSQVVDLLASDLDIKFGETVKHIRHDRMGVAIETESGPYAADFAIVTLPLGVLKARSVAFTPDLSESKKIAISALKMGDFNKIAMRFSEPFWSRGCGFIELIPERKELVCQFLDWHFYSDEPVLVACIAADTARQWEAYSDAEIRQRMMAILRQYFGPQIPEPVSLTITRWGKDEFSRGCYSVFHPGAEDDLFEALAEPQGRLFFAGEATRAVHQGSVRGAYVTGIRAASEIMQFQ